MELLQQFYENKALAAAVQGFIGQTLEEKALEDLFNGNMTHGYPEAKKIYESVFIKLRQMYEPPVKSTVTTKR